MKPLAFAAIIWLLCDGLFGQDCSNGGQCFRTPVRTGLSNVATYVVENKPVRQAVAATFTPRVLTTCGCGCGIAGCRCQGASGFRVSSYEYDVDGALIISRSSIQTLTVAESVQQSEVSALGIRKRRASREVILEAANKAHEACTIDSDQLKAIRLACMSPRMLSKLEDLIIAKAQASGAYAFKLDANGDVIKSSIDWEAIGDFIVKIAPIIFKLIELFVYAPRSSDIDSIAMFDINFVATHGILAS